MQAQGGPDWSRGERFQKLSPYRQQSQRQYRQQSQRQGREKQEPRNGRSSRQSPVRDRNSRQQETNGRAASRRTASLEVLLGDVNDGRNH
ncbi:hypothetical protein TNCV_2955961 [Trichonephila clavipes]|nr:hypothetical protein TNCV_2955961 [Trichonephila clavipes]